MNGVKKILKIVTPSFILGIYHCTKAYMSALLYNFPSKKLIVIGITGTKGKSSTANFMWSGLTSAGLKVGLLSTANIRIGNTEYLNKYHMTMPSPLIIQKKLYQMLEQKCNVAIIEVTSEGIKQYRHIGINFDILIFTNLTPEHISSHGSFENYKLTKLKIFKNLSKSYRKIINDIKIPKVIIANADSPESGSFLEQISDVKIKYSIYDTSADIKSADYNLKLQIPGQFNIYNALPALAVSKVLKLNTNKVVDGLNNLSKIPGRMEILQDKPFKVIIDYAHEKVSLTELLVYAKNEKKQGKIILLIGAEGGGRDKSKRKIMGEIGAREADFLIISNVDPYDEDPKNIISDIANAAENAGMKVDKNLFLIENREDGILKAIKLAQSNDIVLITGKGAEQSMIIGNSKIPWDDREVAKKIMHIK